VSEGLAAGVVEQEARPGGAWRACMEGVGGKRYAELDAPPVVPPVCAVAPPAVRAACTWSSSFMPGRPRLPAGVATGHSEKVHKTAGGTHALSS
jgi:hypothetical protein